MDADQRRQLEAMEQRLLHQINDGFERMGGEMRSLRGEFETTRRLVTEVPALVEQRLRQ